jgi:hypothetical protein
MHALLIKHADELVGCTEGSPEEAELSTLANVIDAYETKRWPGGKAAGAKDDEACPSSGFSGHRSC